MYTPVHQQFAGTCIRLNTLRLHSTAESVKKGEPTLIAIIETLIVVGLSLWLVWYRGTVIHVAVGVCVAPFALMRSERATALVWWLVDRLSNLYLVFVTALVTRLAEFHFVLALIIAPPIVFFAFLLLVFALAIVRPLGTGLAFFRYPFDAVKAIPKNWTATVLTIDSAYPPEAMPDADAFRERYPNSILNFLAVGSIALEFERLKSRRALVVGKEISWLVLALLWGPSLLYRFSIKSTALFALPLLWIVNTTFSDKSPRQRVDDLFDDPIEKGARWYAVAVVLFTGVLPVIKYASFLALVAWLSSWSHPLVARIVSGFRVQDTGRIQVDLWYFARLFGACLTLAILLYLAVARHSLRHEPKKEPSAVPLQTMLLFRKIATVYVLGCTLYLFAAHLDWKVVREFIDRIEVNVVPKVN